MKSVSNSVQTLRGLRFQNLLHLLRPFRWFWIATLYAATVSLIHGVQTYQYFLTFQASGFASNHHSSFLSKWITWCGLPGALPAYVMSAFSHSVALVAFSYLLGMLLVYGGVGLLVDGMAGLLRFFRATNNSARRESP